MDLMVYSNVNELVRLTAAIGAAPLAAPEFRLYENDFTPLETSILTDFTEATFGGYVSQTPTWGAPGFDQSGIATAPASMVFTADGTLAGVAYGIYMLGSTGLLVAAARFADGPYNFAVNGDQLVLTVLFGLAQGNVNVAVGP